MKKIIFLFTAITFISSTKTMAQEDKIYGGIKISPNYSVITDKADKWKSGVGFSVGYFEVLELNYKLNLQAEINYSKYAFSNELPDGFDANGVPKTTRKNKTYRSFELPLMAKYRVNDQFAIGLGYQISFNTKMKDETGSASNYASESLNSNEDIFSKIFSPKQSTGGVFLDASFKSEKLIGGLRILQTNKDLIDETHKSINASIYVGIPLF